MKLIIVIFAGLCLWLKVSMGVQPMPGGVSISWNRGTNEASYSVWKMTAPETNWTQLGVTLSTNWVQAGSFTETTKFGVTALTTNGDPVDVGIPHWPPHPTTPANTVTVTPVGGYTVETGKWIRVSSDLSTYDDWLKLRHAGTNVVVEHKAGAIKPKLFITYPNPLTNVPVPAPPIR